jgi:hypothetical protein
LHAAEISIHTQTFFGYFALASIRILTELSTIGIRLWEFGDKTKQREKILTEPCEPHLQLPHKNVSIKEASHYRLCDAFHERHFNL